MSDQCKNEVPSPYIGKSSYLKERTEKRTYDIVKDEM